MKAEEIVAGLTPFVREASRADAVELHGLTRFSGGASRETWSLDVHLRRGGAVEVIPAVFRTDPSTLTEERAARQLEYELIRAAWEHGVVVPEPLWKGPRSLFGTEFFVMRRVPGEALGARFVRADRYAHARAALPAQLARSLARIHQVPLADYSAFAQLPTPPAGVSPAHFQLESSETLMHAVSREPHPVFELALRWLAAHAPATPSLALVHGDFRLGNAMFDESGLTGVLDWEGAHIGDPLEDVGWLIMRSWRFGGAKPVAGVGDLEPFLAAWEAEGGGAADPKRMRFWEAFAYLKWGIITLHQGYRYLSGEHRNVEHAAIGRRAAETEIELLRMMEAGW